ncbi:MAG: hypothetical protein ACYTAF_09665 [Planctomycetota bacterium]|jgi:hypothetical protein
MRFMPLALVLLVVSCNVPPLEIARDEFYYGFKMRERNEPGWRARFAVAKTHADDALGIETLTSTRLEALAILLRISLEENRYEDAEKQLEAGRRLLEGQDVGGTWPGDEGAIHLIKGDYFVDKAQASEDPKVALEAYHFAVTEYIRGKDHVYGRQHSFLVVRLARALVAIGRLTPPTDDVDFRDAMSKALLKAIEEADEEAKRRKNQFTPEIVKLRAGARELLGKLP